MSQPGLPPPWEKKPWTVFDVDPEPEELFPEHDSFNCEIPLCERCSSFWLDEFAEQDFEADR